jgi:hypothetical protein
MSAFQEVGKTVRDAKLLYLLTISRLKYVHTAREARMRALSGLMHKLIHNRSPEIVDDARTPPPRVGNSCAASASR